MTEDRPGNKGDDLDLLNLFERVSRFFRSYFLLIAIFAFIGGALGFTLYKVLPKQYSSSLLLHSFTLTNTEQINIIENWNELLKNREYETLGERLHCSPSLISKVTQVSAAEIIKLYSENNPNGFNVEVMVKDNAVLDSLQDGIIYGLEHTEYMKERLATKRANFTELVEKVKTEISKLDSTKKSIESNVSNNTQHPSSYILDISGINAQMISLNEKLLNYEEQLKFMNAVQVLHKFEKFQYPASPKFLKLVVLGIIGGFAVGYMLALYVHVKKKLKARSR
ncbi:MAG: hypothetical protein QM737_08255 [Ferruginibacter sp.]